MDDRRAALLWKRANMAIAAGDLHIARQRLQHAISLSPANTIFIESLASVESQLMEMGPRKRGGRKRRQAT